MLGLAKASREGAFGLHHPVRKWIRLTRVGWVGEAGPLRATGLRMTAVLGRLH